MTRTLNSFFPDLLDTPASNEKVLTKKQLYHKEYYQIYYEENKEKLQNSHKKYYKENKENIKEYQEKNKEKIKQQQKEYREMNKEKTKQKKREYREKNKEKIKQKKKEYYEENKDKILEYKKQYDKENKEYKKQYYEENKEEIHKHNRKYRLELKIRMLNLTSRSKCEICGLDDPFLLEWHHFNPESKEFSVAISVHEPNKYSDDIILKEVDKCQILCRNCHRVIRQRKDFKNLKYTKLQITKINFIDTSKINSNCLVCGLQCNENNSIIFDFHHRDPKTKRFSLSRSYMYSSYKTQNELDKCDLLCASCHQYLHSLLGSRYEYDAKRYHAAITKIRNTPDLYKEFLI